MSSGIVKLSHQEISQNRHTVETLKDNFKLPVYVLLDSIRSSYNVGSIFRTSDGAMIKKLFLCGYTPHPPRKDVLKTALGSEESIEWEYCQNAEDVILQLKKEGVKICALEQTSDSIPYFNVEKKNYPICLIVGNEIKGVSQNLIDLCDFAIDIPQYGIKQSLNVAVAYGITIFELRKIHETGNPNHVALVK